MFKLKILFLVYICKYKIVTQKAEIIVSALFLKVNNINWFNKFKVCEQERKW